MLGSSSSLFGLLATTSGDSNKQPPSSPTFAHGTITGLHRYAVKGLTGDSLESVHLCSKGETFPDDRRYALMYRKNLDKFNQDSPEWLHKENFLCAFTHPKFLSTFRSSYQICMNMVQGGNTDEKVSSSSTTTNELSSRYSLGLPCDKVVLTTDDDRITATTKTTMSRNLILHNRATDEIVLGPVDLATHEGRNTLGHYFSEKSGLDVVCVMAAGKKEEKDNTASSKHQFGNTSSGWKQRKDTRTLHIINAATVRDVANKLNLPNLNPTRFRPNIIVDGWEPWSEFDWIGKQICIEAAGEGKEGIMQKEENDKHGNTHQMHLSIISKTVRCDGVSVDPCDPDTVLDIPALLSKNFPQYGPFLGVYAVIEEGGTLSIGDKVFPVIN